MANESSSNNNDDAEKMRLAFEQFMLTGGKNNNPVKKSDNNDSSSSVVSPQSTSSKNKKKKKKKRPSTGVTPKKVVATPLSPTVSTTKQPSLSPSVSSSQQQQQSTPNPKIKKRYYQMLRSFNDKVKTTWMDIDEQLLSVLQNIVSIRGRLPLEWKVLMQAKRDCNEALEEDYYDVDDNGDDDWKSFGHHGSSKETHHLRIDDIQLALSHDLEQHEKMLIGLRSLMSNMAECHDALGRIVDTLWQFHLEGSDIEHEGVVDADLENIVNCVTSSYQMLSMEVYKKQNVVSLVIDSTKDDILGIDELVRGHDVKTKSQKLVRECCESWKRSITDEELLSNVMRLGEPS